MTASSDTSKGMLACTGRLIGAGNPIQEKSIIRMSETRLPLPLNTRKKKNQACRKEIQHNHDVPFIHPIRNQAADGRHDNKRKERYAGYHTQKRRRSGNGKQVQRKGKPDDRISEQGNDPTDYNEIKILGKSFFI